MNNHVNAIFSEKKSSTIAEDSAQAYIIVKAQKAEDKFLEDIENASYFRSIGNYDAWINTIPSLDKLKEIMDDREVHGIFLCNKFCKK